MLISIRSRKLVACGFIYKPCVGKSEIRYEYISDLIFSLIFTVTIFDVSTTLTILLDAQASTFIFDSGTVTTVIVSVVTFVVTATVMFFITKSNIKKDFQQKIDTLTKDVNDLKLELKDLENKDNIQQTIIEQLEKTLDKLPDVPTNGKPN